MSWMQRLKRVFHIDVEHCGVCGGTLRVIACIETPLKCRSRSELARSSRQSSPISPCARPAASITPAPRRCVRPQPNSRPPHPRPHPDCARAATPPRCASLPAPFGHPVFATCFHDCRLQIAAFRPRPGCSCTEFEPDNDHADTPATMSIGGLFFLSVTQVRISSLVKAAIVVCESTGWAWSTAAW